jgi:hypothetical protein
MQVMIARAILPLENRRDWSGRRLNYLPRSLYRNARPTLLRRILKAMR